MERYLMHHGVEGQKWGVRRWQNPDGSLTPAGREHYGLSSLDMNAKYRVKDRTTRMTKYMEERKQLMKSLKQQGKLDNKGADKASKKEIKSAMEAGKKEIDNYLLSKYGEQTVKDVKTEKAIVTGTVVTTAVLASAYAGSVIYAKTDMMKKEQFMDEYYRRIRGQAGFEGRGYQNSPGATEDYEITPETRVFRVSGDKSENLGTKTEGAYVTTNRKDAAIYDRFLPVRDKDGNVVSDAKKYRNEYKSNKNIKIAGIDAQRRLMRETLEAKFPGQVTDEHVNNFLQDLNVGTPFRNKSNEEHDRCFGTGNIAKVKHELFDDWQGRMKKAGYGGMVDANDSQTMSKRATYLFGDDNTAFNKQKQREVAYNPIEKVKDRFYDPTNAFDRNKLKDYYDK